MFQPPGFVDPSKPDHVCKLEKSLYGLKQAPRAWNACFTSFITRQGFIQSKCDASLFVYQKNNELTYLLLYVDDIIITASSSTLLQSVITSLKSEFEITDMGKLQYFLGVAAQFNDAGLFLTQSKYAEELIKRAGMEDCKPCSTPADLNSKLSANEGYLVSNPTEYRSLAGVLQCLTFTRPDISYAV